MSNRSMIGATCTGCEQESSTKLGTVQQMDLGSPDKWHPRCYRLAELEARRNVRHMIGSR